MSKNVNPTILVIEDDKLLLNAIGKKMSVKNIPAYLYSDAKTVVKDLTSGKIKPDSIWLDYYLGDMNGLELLQKIKNIKKYAKIPVVVVSNSANTEHVQAMLALGANKYILKAEHRMEDIIELLIQLVKENGGK